MHCPLDIRLVQIIQVPVTWNIREITELFFLNLMLMLYFSYYRSRHLHFKKMTSIYILYIDLDSRLVQKLKMFNQVYFYRHIMWILIDTNIHRNWTSDSLSKPTYYIFLLELKFLNWIYPFFSILKTRSVVLEVLGH
jgi:hypothetical protein